MSASCGGNNLTHQFQVVKTEFPNVINTIFPEIAERTLHTQNTEGITLIVEHTVGPVFNQDSYEIRVRNMEIDNDPLLVQELYFNVEEIRI